MRKATPCFIWAAWDLVAQKAHVTAMLPSTPRFMSALGATDILLGTCCGLARPAPRSAHPDLSSRLGRQSTFLTLDYISALETYQTSYLNGVMIGCDAL